VTLVPVVLTFLQSQFTSHHPAVLFEQLNADGVATQSRRYSKRCPRTRERVKYKVAGLGKKFDEPLRQSLGERCAMSAITALGREMDGVATIG
jgi:hypothetical protein